MFFILDIRHGAPFLKPVQFQFAALLAPTLEELRLGPLLLHALEARHGVRFLLGVRQGFLLHAGQGCGRRRPRTVRGLCLYGLSEWSLGLRRFGAGLGSSQRFCGLLVGLGSWGERRLFLGSCWLLRWLTRSGAQ